MGGKVYDRKPLVVDRDPSKTLAVEVGKFAKPNPVDLALAFGNALLDYGLDAFKNVTGIDLKSWTSFLDALPGFDAGKIISGIFSGGLIPGLDASKIVSGVFNTVVIPFLDAGKIISGIFTGGRIPGLDASKIISGQFPMEIVSGLTSFLNAIPGGNIVGSIASSLLAGVLGAGLIPGLDASKITSGTFAQSLITGLPAALSGIVSNVSSVIDSIVEQWGGGSGGGAPAVPSVASVGAVLGNANRTIVPVPVPAGTVKDDVVLVFIDNSSAVPTPMTPAAGFLLAPNTGYQTVDQATQLRVYWKRCTAADSGTYDFTFDTANYCKAVAIRCADVIKTGNPIDADVFVAGNANTLAGLSLTTTDDNALLVWAANSWGSQVLTPPAGFTSRVAYSSSGGLAVGSAIQAADGPTGSKTGTISGYSGHCEWMGALKAGTEPAHHTIPDLVAVLNAIPGAKLIGSVASSLLSGILGGGLIPGLDASKIVSGIFPQAMVNITSIATNLLTGAINAALIPALDASKIVTGVFQQSMVNITNIAAGIVNGIFGAGQIPGLDASKITSGSFAQTQVTGLPAVVTDFGNRIRGAVDGIVNSLTNATGVDWQQSDANAALEAQAAAVAAAAVAVAALQAQNGGGNGGGITVAVDFSTYPDSPEMPSNFTTTYFGGSSGTYGTYGVTNGVACSQRNEQYNEHKAFISEYNVVDTVTDYQRLTVVWGNSPGYSYQNPTPYFTPTPWYGAYRADTQILFRYKDVDNWTRFRFLASNFISPALTVLETCVNGTITKLFSNNHALQANTAYYVEAGTPGDIRTYRLILGSKVVFSYTDSSNVSQVGAAFRGSSLGGDSYGAQGAGTPASTSRTVYFAIQDNSPSSTVGSGARVYKAATGAWAFNGATSSNFFDTVEYITPDMVFAPASGCRITVSKTDWYVVTVKLRYNGTASTPATIYKNGVMIRYGPSPSSGSSFMMAIVYLQAGDYVQAGSGGNTQYVGSADGTATSFEIARVGKAA